MKSATRTASCQHKPPLFLSDKLNRDDFSQFGASAKVAVVVVPTYNEALNVESLLAEILAQGPQFDVLVVDDNSPDGTGDIVDEIAHQTSRVQLHRRARKLGLGTAYLHGFRHALQQGYSFVFQMDADFSHQPHYLPILLSIAEHDADVAVGSRNVPGARVENWSWKRNLLSKGGSLYARLVCGISLHDCTGGFKCFRANVLRTIDLDSIHSTGYGFQVELNYVCFKAGFHVVEYPIIFPDRVAGQSKMSGGIIREAALMVWRLRLKAPTGVQRDPAFNNDTSGGRITIGTLHDMRDMVLTGPAFDAGESQGSDGNVKLVHSP
ncbi:MAG: polyprenol monophosphomannose synthase [Aggregatilineales bacterium]